MIPEETSCQIEREICLLKGSSKLFIVVRNTFPKLDAYLSRIGIFFSVMVRLLENVFDRKASLFITS